MENIYHTIRGRTKSPRTLESNSKDPLSAATPYNLMTYKHKTIKNNIIENAIKKLGYKKQIKYQKYNRRKFRNQISDKIDR